ncbi:Vta1 like-domain-containing protein, partial [Lactifluus volemus]
YLGLPPIPPDLKPITSYLQRAHDTRTQDPVISYWCAYYAAQVGIGLRVVSSPNRTFLASLLTTLENVRSTVGPSDAIIVESASSAYVENFALRVFSSADNEDRCGTATRKTAKKFLAAATFFEVLNVFEDRGPWEAHKEKVRYAKWRAADISKALREGRQPS